MKIKKKKKEKKKDVYDFAFEGNKEKLSSKEKELAIDLMEKHFRFFGVINYLKENEAVLRGAKITCTHGNKTICLDTYKDHGVYDHEIPVMTCSDCKQGQNIYSFGACGNDKFEPVYSEQLPAPKGYVKDAQGVDRHKCLPLLDKSWGTGGSKSRIAIVCFNGIGSGDWLWNKMDYTDERKLAVLEEYSGMINKGEYVEILLSQANLLCLYGGVITIEQNPEVDEITIIEEENYLITMSQMEEFNFTITDEELAELNDLLKKYNITDKGSIALFMAACGHESAMGTKLLEDGDEAYFKAHNYSSQTRGAGYMQITGAEQEKFYKEALNIEVPTNPAQDIANNYAWHTAVWEWGQSKKGSGVVMNKYVEKNGSGENIFLITQYFINSYLDRNKYPQFDSDLADIRAGGDYSYDLDAGILKVGENTYRLPVNYADRKRKYDEAIKIFMEEQ